jgi:hypothetical protein
MPPVPIKVSQAISPPCGLQLHAAQLASNLVTSIYHTHYHVAKLVVMDVQYRKPEVITAIHQVINIYNIELEKFCKF